MTKTDAVLVTYNPDIDILVQCIESLSSQVRTIWLVDNSSTTCNFKSSFEHLPDEIEIIKLMGNTGIAYAQNIGIEKAIENGIKRFSKTVDNVESAWVKEQKVVVRDGEVAEFRVTMTVTFLLND